MSTNVNQAAPNRNRHTRWLALALGALLASVLVPGSLRGQDKAPAAEAKPKPRNATTWWDTNSCWCDLKFDGGSVEKFRGLWQENCPKDNFVVSESAREVRLPAFEVRNVRLAELARSIAFLSQDTLIVELVEAKTAEAGNIWRIGTPATAGLRPVKVKAVAAPRLFSEANAVDKLVAAAREIEDRRFETTWRMMQQDGLMPRHLQRAYVVPLSAQKVFVLMGDENGVAGLESFLQAAEQAAEPAKASPNAK